MVLADELDVDVLGKGVNEALKGVSPSGLVPCLQVAGSAGGIGGDFTVWETLSIIEFLHEAHPGAGEALCAHARGARVRILCCDVATRCRRVAGGPGRTSCGAQPRVRNGQRLL